MRIARLRAEGFRGIRGAIDIEFPGSFTVITGRNGSGKSTICDAIEYALTGRINKHYQHVESGEQMSDYTWWRGTGSAAAYYVTLSLVTDTGAAIEITRTADGKSTVSDVEIGQLLCNLPSPPHEALKELCVTSIIRDESITQTSVDLTETDRFRFVRDAIGTSSLTAIEGKCDDIVKTLEDMLATSESEYRVSRQRVEVLIPEIGRAEAKRVKGQDVADAEDVLRTWLEIARGQTSDLSIVASKRLTQLRERVAALEEVRKQLTALETQRTEIETAEYVERLRVQEDRIDELRRAFEAAKRELETTDEQIRLQEREEPRLASLAELYTHGRRLGLEENHCPLCGSEIGENQYLQHVEGIHSYVTKQQSLLASWSERRASLHDQLRQMQGRLTEAQRTFESLKGAGDAVAASIGALQVQLGRLGVVAAAGRLSAADVATLIDGQRADIVSIEAALATLESSSAMNRVATLRQDLEEAREASKGIEAQLAKVGRALERARSIRHTVKRVSNEMGEDRLAGISPLMAEIYYRLRPHIEWTGLNYRMRGDVRRFVSLAIGEDLNPRFMFSSGQRRILGLAFLLAVYLSRDWCRLRTLVLDDPVQHVDDYRALHLTEVLSAIRRSDHQILCTVEDPALARLLTRRLRSAEQNEGSLVSMAYDIGEGVHVEAKETIPPVRRLVLEQVG